jgi:uncharacterized protein
MPKFSVMPKEGKFFRLFAESARNTVEVSQKFKELVYNWDNLIDRVAAISDLEHKGDNVTHEIITESRRTFLTPFDREDITSLAQSLDDVTDFIHSAADFILIYRVEQPTLRAKELADIIVTSTLEVQKGIALLTNQIDQTQILKHCVEINRMENEADIIYRTALVELFANTTDEKLLIKWREIYENMETVTDKCEDVANALEALALKYS